MHSHDWGSHRVKCDSDCFTGFWDIAGNRKTDRHTHTWSQLSSIKFAKTTGKSRGLREKLAKIWQLGWGETWPKWPTTGLLSVAGHVNSVARNTNFKAIWLWEEWNSGGGKQQTMEETQCLQECKYRHFWLTKWTIRNGKMMTDYMTDWVVTLDQEAGVRKKIPCRSTTYRGTMTTAVTNKVEQHRAWKWDSQSSLYELRLAEIKLTG